MELRWSGLVICAFIGWTFFLGLEGKFVFQELGAANLSKAWGLMGKEGLLWSRPSLPKAAAALSPLPVILALLLPCQMRHFVIFSVMTTVFVKPSICGTSLFWDFCKIRCKWKFKLLLEEIRHYNFFLLIEVWKGFCFLFFCFFLEMATFFCSDHCFLVSFPKAGQILVKQIH